MARVPYPMPYFQTKMRPVGPKKIRGDLPPPLILGSRCQVPPTPPSATDLSLQSNLFLLLLTFAFKGNISLSCFSLGHVMTIKFTLTNVWIEILLNVVLFSFTDSIL